MSDVSPEEETRYAELQAIALDAARHGELETLAPMLEAGLPMNLADEKGNSLLMLAAYNGQPEIVTHLLEKGADPDSRNDKGQTPLAGVAFKGNLDIVKLLVESGADPSADQGGGRTPVMFAALFGNTQIADYLQKVSQTPGKRIFLLKPQTLARFTAPLRALFLKLRKMRKPSSNS